MSSIEFYIPSTKKEANTTLSNLDLNKKIVIEPLIGRAVEFNKSKKNIENKLENQLENIQDIAEEVKLECTIEEQEFIHNFYSGVEQYIDDNDFDYIKVLGFTTKLMNSLFKNASYKKELSKKNKQLCEIAQALEQLEPGIVSMLNNVNNNII